MSTTHEQPTAQHAEGMTPPGQRTPSSFGEHAIAPPEVPFGIPTPRDDEGFEPTIIRGRE